MDGSSDKYDVQNIAAHESGHWLVLDDLYDTQYFEMTMYGYSSRGETKKRTLEWGDLAGIRFIYPSIGSRTDTFKTNPSSFVDAAGTIRFDSTTYLNGQSGSYSDGDYSATANAPIDYRFELWMYPSDKWERIWYIYSGSPSNPWSTYLGVGPDEANVNFDNDWKDGNVAYNRYDLIGFISSRTVNIAAGSWTFTVGSDGGVRLYIDDQLVINCWKDQPYTTYTYTTAFSSTANHLLRLEWYENGGGAHVSFDMQQVGAEVGLRVEYYSSSSPGEFTTKVLERVDSTVNFDWGSGSPGSEVPSDGFAVRWTGSITAPTSGTYTIWVATDNGVRLWIDGFLCIDKWYDQPTTEYSWTGTLSAGKHSIKVEYYENVGGAVIKLGWTPPGGSKAYPIPSSNLSPY